MGAVPQLRDKASSLLELPDMASSITGIIVRACSFAPAPQQCVRAIYLLFTTPHAPLGASHPGPPFLSGVSRPHSREAGTVPPCSDLPGYGLCLLP